jgi:hypothetical protein
MLVLFALVGAGWAAPAVAQAPAAGGDGWWRRWSPLAPVADLVRPPAPVPVFPLLTLTPAPRLGLTWTAGNPGALARDAAVAHTEFRGSVSGESGTYRRPLDAGRTGGVLASASGWRPLGASGGVVGGVTVERASMAGGVPADIGEPYGMTPHLFADSSGTDLGRTLVRLEGAGGWTLGAWGVGLGLGHQSWDTRTGVTQIPRYQRGSRSGATVGVTRDLASGRLRVGAHGRWRSEVQQLSLTTRQAETTAFLFEGYSEPVLTRLAAKQGYVRRVEREGAATAVSAEVEAGGLRWVAFGEASKLDERQFEQLTTNDPPTDHWNTRGHAAGIAAEAGRAEGGTHLLVMLRWMSVSGEATRAGLEEEGVLFEADEGVLDGALDLRIDPGNGWKAGAHVSVGREDRERVDRLARIRSAVRAWRPGFALEAARDVGDRFAVGAGAGLSWYTPSGGIPDPSTLGAGYRDWIGPELAYVATGSRTLSGLVTLRWDPAGSHALTLDARYDHAKVHEGVSSLPLAPEGSRGAWSVGVRWMW